MSPRGLATGSKKTIKILIISVFLAGSRYKLAG
ncbi:MAG TPA: palindromic element RPE4 domain-containing protein [Rickettsia endosymbiont of Pyrocoelia pectoralis]|nr:palindromic element RPE4 domain-containing protein [Rickettsia endosymbiont of Pyrocoelia pectoralis]